jgi:hypothetical protein
MKLAIVPALALAAAGGVALMASPASASPEVGQARVGNPAQSPMMSDAKWYGQDDYKDQGNYGDVCNIYQFFPGTNVLSGQVLNDVVDASVDVIVQVINLLGVSAETGDSAIINSGCP